MRKGPDHDGFAVDKAPVAAVAAWSRFIAPYEIFFRAGRRVVNPGCIAGFRVAQSICTGG